MKIINCPSEAWSYEFIVAYKLSNKLYYFSHTADGFKADRMASQIAHGVVIHNVRIQGQKKD